MTILVAAQAFPPKRGGIEHLMENLAVHAAGAGHRVHVLADGGRAAARSDSARSLPYGIERFTGPRPLRRRLKARRVRRLAVAFGARALFADSWKSLEALAGRPLGVPTVAFGHGNEFSGEAGKRARIRRSLAVADALICVSAATLERAREFVPDGVRTTVIHPPVAPLDEPEPADARFADMAWGEASPRLLSMARLIELKGIDQAIRAVAAIRERHPALRLVVAGSGPDRARLERIAVACGVADRVGFVGWVDGGRKSALLRSADVLLLPGRQVGGQVEGAGIVYREAALAGVPAIAGERGGASEVVLDDETGLLVDGESVPGIADALSRLVSDPSLHARLAERARAVGADALWPREVSRILEFAFAVPDAV